MARSWDGGEEGRSGNRQRRHDECAVEVVVAHLARGLSDERASVACGAVQPPTLHSLSWRMLGADRVVRAQAARTQRDREMRPDVPSLRHQATERAFSV